MQLLHKASIRSQSPADACAADVLDAIPRVMQFIRSRGPRRPEGGLSVQQFRALGFLRSSPGSSLSDLATYFGLTLPAASRLVGGLVTRKLVERTPIPHNRRQLKLTVLPAGQKLMQSAIRDIRSQIRARLDALPDQRLKSISQAMRILAAELSRPDPDDDA